MKTNGTVGETYCETRLFPACGFVMVRTQPPMRCIGEKHGVPIYQIEKNKSDVAPPDYTGYKMGAMITGCGKIPHYVACEVKDCYSESMPCSRLSPKQRNFMRLLPSQCAYVAVYWANNLNAELFCFKIAGSYPRGKGIKTA